MTTGEDQPKAIVFDVAIGLDGVGGRNVVEPGGNFRMQFAEAVAAAQAERWGLVTSLADDPLAAALALADEIAGRSPSAIRAAKRLIGVAECATQAEVLLAESRESVGLIGKADQMEVIAAQMQGRKAVFG